MMWARPRAHYPGTPKQLPNPTKQKETIVPGFPAFSLFSTTSTARMQEARGKAKSTSNR